MGTLKVEIENVLNYSEAARQLGITRSTLYTWIEQGRFHPMQIGRGKYLGLVEVEKVKAERKGI